MHLERATLHLLVSILATSPSKPFVLIVPKFHTASKKSPLAHSPSFESALRAMNVKIYHQDAIFVPDGLHPNQPSWTFAYQKFLAWTIDEETCTGKKPIPGRNNGKSFGSHSVLLLDLDQILLRNMERLFDGFERYLSEYSAFCAGDYLQGGCNIMSPYMMSNILLFRPNQTTFEALVNILRSMPTKDWPYVILSLFFSLSVSFSFSCFSFSLSRSLFSSFSSFFFLFLFRFRVPFLFLFLSSVC